jgi:hypothetical protein
MTTNLIKQPDTFLTIADGLDASVNGRGWGAEHERAKNLANAAPAMYDALGLFIAQYQGDGKDDRERRPEMIAARAAIALVDSPPKGPAPSKVGATLVQENIVHAPDCSRDCEEMPDGRPACHTPIETV